MISIHAALLLLRRRPIWNKHVAERTTTQHVTSRHVTTRMTRGACRVVTGRDVTQQVYFGL